MPPVLALYAKQFLEIKIFTFDYDEKGTDVLLDQRFILRRSSPLNGPTFHSLKHTVSHTHTLTQSLSHTPWKPWKVRFVILFILNGLSLIQYVMLESLIHSLDGSWKCVALHVFFVSIGLCSLIQVLYINYGLLFII